MSRFSMPCNRRPFRPSKMLPAAIVVAASALLGCQPETARNIDPPAPTAPAPTARAAPPAKAFAGSKSCVSCHEDFYKLWATSWHGLAMQPFTPAFAQKHLAAQQAKVKIGNRTYRVEIGDGGGAIREISRDGEKQYPMVHVMGGKNVYYFLTPLERGRLQVLPLAYDVHKQNWYDTTASGVRHFPDRRDEALDWKDRLFTFNTTCFNCHVSELATNYDLQSDTYHTSWAEPGISCESCHGTAGEHPRMMELSPNSHGAKDIGVIRTRDFTSEQMNDMCATCHAKIVPLSVAFRPGEKFFDHYDLVTLEHQDFYPDGRDLGENYTYTSWLMSPCLKSGKLDCNHCHTPSGRMRFEGKDINKACLPCHEKEVGSPTEHSHHAADSKGNECVTCHMPMTRFAAMGRSDHSMRPPTPAATAAFQSPNACNICHADHDAAWADTWVRTWYPGDYQADVLHRAGLVDAARKQQWQRLPEILAELANPDEDPVHKASLLRLLIGCTEESKWPVIVQSLSDPSPLVRSSAASALKDHLTPETLGALLKATSDPSRLVRIRSAMALAAVPPESLANDRQRQSLVKACAEFNTAMRARPDDWASYANIGNFYMERREFAEAVRNFEISYRIEPRSVGPMVNAAIAYSNMQRAEDAQRCLERALKAEPANAAANFNMGLLLGEQGRPKEAEQAMRAALKSDPQMAAAAYNLGVLLSADDLDEAIVWCRKANQLRPDDPKYAQALAFFLRKKGDAEGAIQVLRQVIEKGPFDLDVQLLLCDIYQSRGDRQAALGLLRAALKQGQLPPAVQRQLQQQIGALEDSQSSQGQR